MIATPFIPALADYRFPLPRAHAVIMRNLDQILAADFGTIAAAQDTPA